MLIREHSSGKGKKPMPAWARIVAAVVGLLLLIAGFTALLVMRPLELQFGIGAVSAAFLGLDLLVSAGSGKWPVALQWMPFI